MVLSELEEKLKQKEYREKNKEKRKEYLKNNKEKIKKQRAEYRKNTKEQRAEYKKKYNQNNKEHIAEYNKEYNQTENGKKSHTIGKWKSRGLIASNEELNRIYNLYLTQVDCNACDIKLTRNGANSATDATMDHDHITNKFRHIICRSCNCQDKWLDYFC